MLWRGNEFCNRALGNMWCRFQLELEENEITHSEEMGNKDLLVFLKGTKKKIFKKSLTIIDRFLRGVKTFSTEVLCVTLIYTCWKWCKVLWCAKTLCFVPRTCSQPGLDGESSYSHRISWPNSALYFLALDLGPGPVPIKLVRARTRLTMKLISHCWLVREPHNVELLAIYS